jgi:predicted nucleic acid-binding protein
VRDLFGRIRWEGDLHRERLDEPEHPARRAWVLVDSSVWIDHLRGVRTRETAILRTLLAWLDPQEGDDQEGTVELGRRSDPVRGPPRDSRSEEHAAVRHALLNFEVVTIGGVELALAAADHYRALRRLGVTVRMTIDLLIGTYCIAQDCALLHSDRDFDPMTQRLGLRAL